MPLALSNLKYPLTALTSELLLALQPVLVKAELVSLPASTLIRVMAYVCIGVAVILFGLVKSPANIFTTGVPIAILYGFTNLAHILASHYGFTEVDLGVSSALQYLYPLYVVLQGVITGLDPLNWKEGLAMVLSAVGVWQIFAGSADYKSWSTSGAVAALGSGLTEAIIIILARQASMGAGPLVSLIRMQLWSALIILPAIYFTPLFPNSRENIAKDVREKEESMLRQFIGHILFGFVGHVLMFSAVQNLRPITYGVIVLIGALLQPLQGSAFFGEPITQSGSIGIGAILASAAIVLLNGSPKI